MIEQGRSVVGEHLDRIFLDRFTRLAGAAVVEDDDFVIAGKFGHLMKLPRLVVEAGDAAKQKRLSVAVNFVVNLGIFQSSRLGMVSSRAQHAAPLPPLFGTCAVGSVQLVDEAAFVQSTSDAAVDNILEFDIAHLGIACFQQALHVAQPFDRGDWLSIHPAS